MNRTAILMLLAIGFVCFAATGEQANQGKNLVELYPGVTSGALSFATLGELPDSVLLKKDELEITSAELESELAGANGPIQEQLAKNKLFLLDNLATSRLLLLQAKADDQGDQPSDASKRDLIQKYLEGVVADVEVTDDEVARFYEENKDMFGGASLDQIKDQLEDYVLGQKKQDAVKEHIRTMGQRMNIVVAADWVKEQAKRALDNPVDKARGSGKPSLIDFGSTGCRPCDMMAPILDTLKTKYEGKLNVLFIHVQEEQILASRYGIQSIPVQIFFDKNGKEVFRHTGFYPQEEIEKQLTEMGVK